MVSVTHAKVTGAAANPNAIVDGPAWDAAHVVSITASDVAGLAASATTDTTNASNITSGTLPAARLPNPTASTLGGIESLAAVGSKWINTISTSGVPSATQPAFTDISGSVAASQLPNPSASTLGGIQSAAAVSHQWINSISTSGVPALSQPAISDLSDVAWTTWSPTLAFSTPGSPVPTFASTAGRYKQIGKVVYFTLDFQITNNGTGANGSLTFTLPVATNASNVLVVGAGKEVFTTGKSLAIQGSSTTVASFTFYDNTSPITAAATSRWQLGGFYEAA